MPAQTAATPLGRGRRAALPTTRPPLTDRLPSRLAPLSAGHRSVDPAQRAGQSGYAAKGLEAVGVKDAQLALAAFWVAKTLEAVGALLFMASPLVGLFGMSARSVEVAGAAMLVLFLALVTPVLHHPATDQTGFLKNLALAGGLLYAIASSPSKSGSKTKPA